MEFVAKDDSSRIETRGSEHGFIRETSARLREFDGQLAIEDNNEYVSKGFLNYTTSHFSSNILIS